MNVLDVERISAGYGDTRILWDLSLAVPAGQLVALVGANGAGKTTTLRAICGLVPVGAGTIRYQGEVVSGRPVHEVVERGITLVPEGRQLFPKMTVEENLRAGAYLRRTHARRAANLEKVYGLFPRLKERRGQIAETMSGGEQQMLAIGRALMQDPRLIMFDEPSLGLSPLMVEEIFRIIRRLHEEGLTIFLVEQNVAQTLQVADRAYVIEHGRVVREGSGAELAADPKVREAYLGF